MDDTSIPAVLLDTTVRSLPFLDATFMSDAFLDQLPVGIATCDSEGVLVRYNRHAAELWGHAPELKSGTAHFCGALKHYGIDGAPISTDDLPAAEVFRTRVPLRDKEIVFERPGGGRVWVSVNADPLLDDRGQLTGVVCCFVNITSIKLKQQEQSVREVLDALPVALYDMSERKRGEDQKALINVLNHRVKNMLATVQALASQTIRGRGVKREVRTKFIARLFALTKAHDLLARESWLSADLNTIVREMLEPYHGRIEIQGKSLRISPKTALTLSMVLHELAANATQHGSLSLRSGKVLVSWAVDSNNDGEALMLSWSETNGPPISEPARHGFGLRLVERSIVQELSGKMDIAFQPSGFRATSAIPITRAETASPDQAAVPTF